MPGEGELKCIDWLKHMSNPGSEESVVIVGGDADLILQGLALSEVSAQQYCCCFQPNICTRLICIYATTNRVAVEGGIKMSIQSPLSLLARRSAPCTLPDLPGEEHVHLFPDKHWLFPPFVHLGSGSRVRDVVPGPIGLCQE